MHLEKSRTAFTEFKTNGSSTPSGVNEFEAALIAWGIPQPTAGELTRHHTKISYGPGKIIFRQGSPADMLFWVVKGVVREICPNPRGTQTLVRLATAGEILGFADRLDNQGRWTRRFEAWTAGNCVLAVVARQHVRSLLKEMNPEDLLALSERINSASAEWIHYYATFLGLSFRDRIEMVLAYLGRKFGVADSEGILLTFEPTHSDLAEMIGSSRPVVGRVMADLINEGEVGRRDRKYILLRGGSIETAVTESSEVECATAATQPAASIRIGTHVTPQHKGERRSG